MSSISTSALADSGKAVALSVVLGAVLAFVPLLSVLALPALPVPIAFITSRHGAASGLLAALAAGLLCTVFTGPLGGLMVLLLSVVGSGAGIGLRRGVSLSRLFLLVTILFLAALALWSGAVLVVTGMGPDGALGRVVEDGASFTSGFSTTLGMDQSDVEAAEAAFRDLASMLPYLLPALLLVMSIVLSGATVALSRQVFQRLKQPFPAGYRFSAFRLHFAFAYLMIAGLICDLASPYLASGYSEAVALVGMNIIIVSGVLFFIQGLAISHFFMEKYKLSRGWRILVYLALFVIQVLSSLVSWLGLFDTWIDYRRRFGGKQDKDQQNTQ